MIGLAAAALSLSGIAGSSQLLQLLGNGGDASSSSNGGLSELQQLLGGSCGSSPLAMPGIVMLGLSNTVLGPLTEEIVFRGAYSLCREFRS